MKAIEKANTMAADDLETLRTLIKTRKNKETINTFKNWYGKNIHNFILINSSIEEIAFSAYLYGLEHGDNQ